MFKAGLFKKQCLVVLLHQLIVCKGQVHYVKQTPLSVAAVTETHGPLK